MKQILIFLIFILVTACGNQPLAQPENDTLTEVTKLTATPIVTPNIPLSPTASQTAKPTVKPSITPSSTATKTPTPQVHFSFYTPAPIEVVQPGQSINGYTFSEARPISNTIGHSLPFFDWLPSDSNRLLIIRDLTLEVMDITTQEIQAYSDGETMVQNPIWLPTHQSVAYLTSKQNPYRQHVWISQGAETLKSASPIFTTTLLPPLVTSQDGGSIILFDDNWQLIQFNNTNRQNKVLPLIAETTEFIPSSTDHDQLYKSELNLSGDKIVFYNAHNLLLTNLETKEVKHFPLQVSTEHKEQFLLSPQCVRWRPDEQVLALIGEADSSFISDTNYLYILDLNTNKFQQITHPFFYIQNIAWTPDGKNLLISASYNQKWVEVPALFDEPYLTTVDALFLIDVTTNEIKSLSIPDTDAQLGDCKMRWSPDGSKIAFGYFDFSLDVNTSALYIIDVNRP